ncbi:hypothetical protein QR680_015142 [Steinernema hermaphroditum]|uniref:Protein HGH1 homolog n=1 Tax=Steinernema hermaphroditum TaxID=289476 RepID=A0AA39IDI1_9BILA|nr:hypothetical protein QR680_015142 [Steinernema hermaphroditum]
MSESAASELVQFLTVRTRPDVLQAAVGYLMQASAKDEGVQLFMTEDFKIGRALCQLFVDLGGNRSAVFSILTNVVAGSAEAANFVVNQSELVRRCAEVCDKVDGKETLLAAKLLANLSNHFPGKVYEKLSEIWPLFVENAIDLLLKSDSHEAIDYLGYVLVNFSHIHKVRREICSKYLAKFLPLISQRDRPRRRLIAVDIIRNLSFDDENHKTILDDSDNFLTAVLAPLADSNDEIDEEEMSKLPIRLQYYDGDRESDPIIRQKLIETLYQLCATKTSREVLRSKGVYYILRELDKATAEPADPNAPPPKMKLTDQEHTLHALIGMLIRYEADLDIDPSLESIRDLGEPKIKEIEGDES